MTKSEEFYSNLLGHLGAVVTFLMGIFIIIFLVFRKNQANDFFRTKPIY